jgi:hypothetical protein
MLYCLIRVNEAALLIPIHFRLTKLCFMSKPFLWRNHINIFIFNGFFSFHSILLDTDCAHSLGLHTLTSQWNRVSVIFHTKLSDSSNESININYWHKWSQVTNFVPVKRWHNWSHATNFVPVNALINLCLEEYEIVHYEQLHFSLCNIIKQVYWLARDVSTNHTSFQKWTILPLWTLKDPHKCLAEW